MRVEEKTIPELVVVAAELLSPRPLPPPELESGNVIESRCLTL